MELPVEYGTGLENIVHNDIFMISKNSSSNRTEILDNTYVAMHKSVMAIILALYVIVIVCSIGGNVFVCYTIYKKKDKTLANFFMTNLAVSDCLVAILGIPFTVLSEFVFHYWPFGSVLCPIVSFVQLTSIFQRSFTLMTITLDQYLVIWRPLRRRLNKKKARILIFFLWIFALLFSIPVLLHSQEVYLDDTNGRTVVCIETWTTEHEKFIYSIFIMIFQYCFPLCTLTVTYIHTAIITWAHTIPGEAISDRDQQHHRSKKKNIKMMFVIVMLYAVSWLPIHTITLLGDTDPKIYESKYIQIIWLISHWSAFSNTAVNPFIYCWRSPLFRPPCIENISRHFTTFKRRESSEDLMRKNSKHLMIPMTQFCNSCPDESTQPTNQDL